MPVSLIILLPIHADDVNLGINEIVPDPPIPVPKISKRSKPPETIEVAALILLALKLPPALINPVTVKSPSILLLAFIELASTNSIPPLPSACNIKPPEILVVLRSILSTTT